MLVWVSRVECTVGVEKDKKLVRGKEVGPSPAWRAFEGEVIKILFHSQASTSEMKIKQLLRLNTFIIQHGFPVC